jgi:hypothetical protein
MTTPDKSIQKKDLETRLEHGFAELRFSSPGSDHYKQVQGIILKDAEKYLEIFKYKYRRVAR